MTWTTPRTWVTSELVTSSLMNTHVRDNLLGALGPAATTIADLNTAWGGTPPDGAPGRLRLGTTPYRYIELKYDATLEKWVSDQWAVQNRSTAGDSQISHNTTVTTQYSDEVILTADYADAISAGLDLQVRFLWSWLNESSSQGYAQTWLYGSSEGGAFGAANLAVIDTGAITLDTTRRFTSDCDLQPNEWHTIAATLDAHEIISVRWGLRSNASPGNTITRLYDMKTLARWVSA